MHDARLNDGRSSGTCHALAACTGELTSRRSGFLPGPSLRRPMTPPALMTRDLWRRPSAGFSQLTSALSRSWLITSSSTRTQPDLPRRLKVRRDSGRYTQEGKRLIRSPTGPYGHCQRCGRRRVRHPRTTGPDLERSSKIRRVVDHRLRPADLGPAPEHGSIAFWRPASVTGLDPNDPLGCQLAQVRSAAMNHERKASRGIGRGFAVSHVAGWLVPGGSGR